MLTVVVTGTGTEVGKTFVSCALLETWRRRGVKVAARKPLQSHEPGATRTDSVLLARATGEDPLLVCPEAGTYPIAMAPPMAAAALDRAVPTTSELARSIVSSWSPETEVGLVEGAGGVASPLASDGDTAALAALLDPTLVVVVAEAGLGTINLVRLTAAALDRATKRRGSRPALAVFLNRFVSDDELHQANKGFLRGDGYWIYTDIESLADRLGRAAGRASLALRAGPTRPRR
ncbi:MAG: ATP-dependent dethiobiotin synthetase BioD [Acidimicrobiales bacterium]